MDTLCIVLSLAASGYGLFRAVQYLLVGYTPPIFGQTPMAFSTAIWIGVLGMCQAYSACRSYLRVDNILSVQADLDMKIVFFVVIFGLSLIVSVALGVLL